MVASNSLRGIVLLLGLGLLAPSSSTAADLREAEELLRTGRYDECIERVSEQRMTGAWGARWGELEVRAELARGKYPEAIGTLEEALGRFPESLSLRLLGHEAYRAAGRDEEARAELDVIEKLVDVEPGRYASPEGRLAIGRLLLLRKADPRQVLDRCFDVAIKERPDFVEAYLATAELALEKQDHALAAETLRKAPGRAAEDPRYHFLLARAFSDEDRARSDKALADALEINPRHVDSLLRKAEHRIDAEGYEEAGRVLEQVLDVNPHEPRAWAYLAALAHLRNDRDGEASARRSALSGRPSNPEVDHILGRELSRKYRFAEGAACQRRALALDPGYLPAKVQICQDLLRLGEEEEGWGRAAEVFAEDGYNVVAFNLVTLRDRLAGFRTLRGDGFVVRMDPREADLYGARVLALLRRARQTLCAKYAAWPREPVVVEIFPRREEFAVRTFGLPGAGGLLGVCFGRVITANSPASQGENPANWEAVLWHEFCHVVTLSKTHNKMPRWLSEGISVYEQGCEDASWGEAPDPRFRAWILGDGLVPLSRLSSAFLGAESPLHLQFAYFESALAVEFLVERAGLPALKGILEDLGAGKPIGESLALRTETPPEDLDRDFARFARRRAEAVAPDATWEEPELPGHSDSKAIAAWLEAHPKSFWGLRRLGARLVAEGDWPRARGTLEGLKALFPGYIGPENAYALLANVYRHLDDTASERKVLEELGARDGHAGAAYLRLMELDEAAGDWKNVAAYARRLLAVNPLIPAPHRRLARAAERLGSIDEAVTAYRALALLDDTDPAEIHYRLARLLQRGGKPVEARREVLKSLEEAPRFPDAHRLLLELVGPAPKPPKGRPEGTP